VSGERDAIWAVGFRQQPLDVLLDRPGREVQPRGDLAIGQPLGEQHEYVHFARANPSRGEPCRDGGVAAAAAGDGPPGGAQERPRGVGGRLDTGAGKNSIAAPSSRSPVGDPAASSRSPTCR
jgi:hypothetical protein